MHWQFGGNLEPLQMICELDWKECPKAISNYIWNEVVIDVLDFLKNDGTVWRIVAVLLACTMLLRTIFSRTKEFIETSVDKELVNKVGYKMEDLELKVNILTYKMQYGSWPLPHQVQKSNFRKHLRNLRLTMSSPNDRNNWIKHVLLSPRRNESYSSCPKYDYRSTHRLTDLFDVNKKLVYPYLRQECLPMERSSKSSKSSSDKSLKLSSIFKRTTNRKCRDAPRNLHPEMQHRHAISLPLFSRNKNKSGHKWSKDSERLKRKAMAGACKNFVKTMDECKQYLKQLNDSNKYLGLVCSSSNFTDESSVKDCWSETQQRKDDPQKDLTTEAAKVVNTEEKTDLKRTDTKQENSPEPSNSICPVLKLSDKQRIPSRMNLTINPEMLPRQSISNLLVPETCDRTQFIKTSQEALYRVKKKLESLHNVLRTYEIQNMEAKASERLQESNNKVNSICQNVVKTIVTATTEAEWNEGRKNRVNFEIPLRPSSALKNSNERYESDESSKSSIQSYVFGASQPQSTAYPSITTESSLIYDNRIVYSSSSKYKNVPERVYYAISSDSEEGKDLKKETTNFGSLQNACINKSQAFSEQYSVPMETDEDVIITSPTSSHTEVSKDSESEDKSTALLLQEALQFRKALLSRVELEKVSYMSDQTHGTNGQPIAECGKYAYINNPHSKFLDIISEEQSVSSSTDKTSRTLMFYNIKQNQQFPQQQINSDKGYLDSKHSLSAPSEYFSFTNIIQEENEDNNNRLSPLRQNYFSTNMTPDNVQIKCFNNSSKESMVKLAEMSRKNCLNVSNASINEQQTCYYEKETFQKHLVHLNDRNEFINESIHSVELYSENLDEAPFDEENQNAISDLLNCKQYNGVSYNEKATDNMISDGKYINENGIPIHIPNFNLRRHPGACSLIEQNLISDIEEETDTNMIDNEGTMYELSATESKGTSIETNPIQESLTSSINQSNDSNIPEPPSVTVLINKSLDEEKLNLDWLNDNTKFSDECINQESKSLSTNTIVIEKYDNASAENCSKKESASVNEYKTEAHQNNQPKTETRNSVINNSFASLDKENLNKETDQYKSYSTLISPHSSIYFTDEASSSATKLNGDSMNHENLMKTIEEKIHHSKDDFKDNKNLGISNENEQMDVTESKKESSKQSPHSESNIYSKSDLSFFRNYVKHTDETAKLKQSSAQRIEKVDEEPSTLHINSNNTNTASSKSMNIPNRGVTNSLISSIEGLHASRYFSPCSSPYNMSPREINQNKTPHKANVTQKSKSHETYPIKSEKLKKSFRSDLLNDDQIKAENKKVKDLSVKSKRTNDIKLDRKRSRSQTSFRTNESKVASRSHESPRGIINYTRSLENRPKYLPPTPKISSKSCIPILKSRLEAARKSENETRPKSPMRGPLTMTMLWKDNLYDKTDVVVDMQVEGKSASSNQHVKENICMEKSYGDNNHADAMKSSDTVKNTPDNTDSAAQQEQMVIYVNIFTKHDQSTTKIVNPNKFLKYIKNRELKIQKVEEGQYDDKNETGGDNEKSTIHKIVTIVSSIINGDELDQSTAKAHSESVLTGDKLRNLCFFSVEQREIDVTAKPSVIDTSTSVSDLERFSSMSKSALNKFQICGIPRELNNEEYVMLLEILHQEQNSVHLQELRNICKKLATERLKSK